MFKVQTPEGVTEYAGPTDRYEVTDGVVKIYAYSAKKPALVVLPLHFVIRIEDFDLTPSP
ncbi:MAG: hypothetical protein QOH08_2336 [Chloroflexota bacterium]|jgi:hypothetical protein|nr:hypothetical protein [Chloroflexota bacterium]